ncbi:hypothetical protein [Rhodococcus koreensis]|uniref:8-oxoguanine DNA glycosylase OGG fold protein n=1 Tax=Rhodococcus koreensis TaxID=99653 RepID=UPI003670FC27
MLSHGFSRAMDACRRLLPDDRMWPAELDEGSENSNRRRIDRRTLFRIAERAGQDTVDIWAAAQLHAAIAIWGAPPGQPMRRALRPLAQDSAPKRFAEALKVVRGEGPESAYKALSYRSRLWIRGLGPSYFTKFLYFGGYGAKRHMPQPLIMDDNVITALKIVTDEPWQASAEDYSRYLDYAADWASELGTSGDVIERRLFQIGE